MVTRNIRITGLGPLLTMINNVPVNRAQQSWTPPWPYVTLPAAHCSSLLLYEVYSNILRPGRDRTSLSGLVRVISMVWFDICYNANRSKYNLTLCKIYWYRLGWWDFAPIIVRNKSSESRETYRSRFSDFNFFKTGKHITHSYPRLSPVAVRLIKGTLFCFRNSLASHWKT